MSTGVVAAGGGKGRQLQVLVEGAYYINRLFATIERIPKTVVEVGTVGVVVGATHSMSANTVFNAVLAPTIRHASTSTWSAAGAGRRLVRLARICAQPLSALGLASSMSVPENGG